MSKILLIDGSSYLFRAYHAMPVLLTRTGQQTGALYGTLNMLKKLIVDQNPQYLAMIFDSKEKNERHRLYPLYKANRVQMPAELADQIAPLFEMIRKLGIPLLQIPGVEADDVIATLSVMAREKGWSTLIVSSDKDLAQLVDDDKIKVMDTSKNVIYDKAAVLAKFGVYPAQMADWLALAGDGADNIPGVYKVGPKIAAQWLAQYGSLENIWDQREQIPGKVGESLRATSDLPLYKQLVLLNTTLSLDILLEDLLRQNPDFSALKALLTEYEIRSWLSGFPQPWMCLDSTGAPSYENTELSPAPASFQTFTSITHIEELEDVFKTQASILVLLFEGPCLYWWDQSHAYEMNLEALGSDFLALLFESVNQLKYRKIVFNLKHVFCMDHIQSKQGYYDLCLASYVFDSVAVKHKMPEIVDKYLNRDWKAANQIEQLHLMLQLFTYFENKMDDALKQVLKDVEMPLVSVLHHMEKNGILIDANFLKEQSAGLEMELGQLEKKAHDIAGSPFNMNSPKQLSFVLFEKLGLPILDKTPTGQPSTADAVLQELAASFDLPKILIDYRSLSKLKSTYTDALPLQINEKTGRVHTVFHQNITATGRLSSSDPNLQNIPIRTSEGRRIRQAFIAEPGYSFLSADYSQIELRIMAHLSEEPRLISAFRENVDIHRQTAAEILGKNALEVTDEERRQAKAVNFGLAYGMSSFGLAKQLQRSQAEAQKYMDLYFEKFPKIKQFMEKTRDQAQAQGYVETLCGRRLYLPNIEVKKAMLRNAQIRAAINAPLQGTNADIIKIAMIQLDQFIKDQYKAADVRLLLQVHDELLFEVSDDLLHTDSQLVSQIRSIMESVLRLAVPLVVEVGSGKSWDAAHS